MAGAGDAARRVPRERPKVPPDHQRVADRRVHWAARLPPVVAVGGLRRARDAAVAGHRPGPRGEPTEPGSWLDCSAG